MEVQRRFRFVSRIPTRQRRRTRGSLFGQRRRMLRVGLLARRSRLPIALRLLSRRTRAGLGAWLLLRRALLPRLRLALRLVRAGAAAPRSVHLHALPHAAPAMSSNGAPLQWVAVAGPAVRRTDGSRKRLL
jgi:hypothetical protein